MSHIQQMYCTHCTHGRSALERRGGELAERTLGYSVRAGSLEGEALRKAYRQVERYVSYRLPHDTPGEQKLHFTAETAPSRLIFIPAAGSWQVIGHVCYRPRDCEGRPGSYFAHLLCRDADSDGEPWTLLDALRLWKAPGWVTEESPDHPFALPAVAGLETMLGGESARIDDSALLAFLRGDDRPFGARLPDRWRDMLPSRRVEILQTLLGGLLQIGTSRRQSLFAAVEPDVAALLFYGLGRLIPPGRLRAGISMSTFETSADRVTTVLAATTFFDPASAEFRVEPLRGRGIALNTFGADWNAEQNHSSYAETMVRRLMEEGPEAADRRLATIASAGPDRIESLEGFAGTERAVAMLFQSPNGARDDSWRADPYLAQFARRLTCERLDALHGDEPALNGICGGASQRTILELACTAGPGRGPDRAIRYLLGELPGDAVAPFVANPEIDDAWKIELLGARIKAAGRMPPGCEWIWTEEPEATPLDGDRCRAIARAIAGGLSGEAFASLLGSLKLPRRLVAIERLLEACDRKTARWDAFQEVVQRLDAASLLALWRKSNARIFEVPESVGPAFQARLQEMLDTLHEHPAEFSERLEFLKAGRRWLTASAKRDRLAAWLDCRSAMGKLIEMQERVGGWRQISAIRRFEAAARRMTEALIRALPQEKFADDRQGAARQNCLREIGRHQCGADFLPPDRWQNEAIWKKIGWRFEMGNWPSAPLRKLARGAADRSKMWVAAAIAAAVVLAALGIISLGTVGESSGKSEQLVLERADGAPRAQVGAPEKPSDAEVRRETRDGLSDGALAREREKERASRKPETEPPDSEPVVPVSKAAGPDEPRSEEPKSKRIAAEDPLVPIPGSFAAVEAEASELKPPAVALVGLDVRGRDDEPLPEWVSEKFVLGAALQEESEVRAVRYLDLPDLKRRNVAELFDGVEKVRVQFRFSLSPAEPVAKEAAIVATSFKWAEVKVGPARRYDIRFILAPEGVELLNRLAESRQ